jgi:nucleotide-binding universal stress UspA family protein
MYKVIVVGTDGSDRATVAVREALELSKVSGAKLHAVQVVHPSLNPGFSDTSGGQLEINELRKKAERVNAQVIAEAEQHGVSAEVHNPAGGDVADALMDVAQSVGADLVVVGNLGMSGIKRLVLGSVPNKVSHRCPCSLLIVDTESSSRHSST